MFHIPRVNVIESDAGFSIELLGRAGMVYRESDKIMYIESEILMDDKPAVATWKDSIRTWGRPYEAETIDEERREEIVERICAALKWRDTEVEIHSHATGWVKRGLI